MSVLSKMYVNVCVYSKFMCVYGVCVFCVCVSVYMGLYRWGVKVNRNPARPTQKGIIQA